MATKAKAPKQPLDHLRGKKRPMVHLQLVLDEEAAARVAELRQEIARSGETPELQAELEAATKARDDSRVRLTLQSIGRKRFNALQEEHPPTDEQIAEYQKATGKVDPDSGEVTPSEQVPDYNPDTFPTILMAQAMVPPVDPDELEELLDEWNDNEYLQLWAATMAAHSVSRVAMWGKG